MIDSIWYSFGSRVVGHRISCGVLDMSNSLDASGARICADEPLVHPSWSGGRKGSMHNHQIVRLCTPRIISMVGSGDPNRGES
jgi:hypothetical protein